MSSQTTDATTQAPDFNTTISLMLFEGGALIAALRSSKQAQAVADKVEQADRNAFQDGHVTFDIALDPIEVGIAFEAASESITPLGNTVAGKLRDALAAKLKELGINYGDQGATAQPSLSQDGDLGQQQPEQSESASTETEDSDAL